MGFPVLPYYPDVSEIGPLNVVGSALISYDSSKVDSLAAFSKTSGLSVYVDLNIESESADENLITSLLSLFNNGVLYVVVTNVALGTDILAKIPNARLAYKVASLASIPAEIPESVPIFAKDVSAASSSRTVFALSPASEDLSALIKKNITPVVIASDLSTEYAETLPAGKVALADLLSYAITTDRNDGLYTTLVTGTDNQSLGLVYSSYKSLAEAIKTGTGVYQSRKHGLWYKGATSGSTQTLQRIDLDCDGDCIRFVVIQAGTGFCHLGTASCFGKDSGLSALESVLNERLQNAPAGSYTKRLFDDEALLNAKIKEEAEELTEATDKDEVAWEAADLFYFALARCAKYGVSISDIERNLDMKSLKVTRRKGDAKPKFIEAAKAQTAKPEVVKTEVAPVAESDGRIVMTRVIAASAPSADLEKALKRPNQKTSDIMKLVNPIIDAVKAKGDAALLELTAKFDKVQLASPVLEAPFPPELMNLTEDVKRAIDISVENVRVFHTAQLTSKMEVETCAGVRCSRFARPVEKVGLYIPGGTAVLPSTALMLGVPANVAGCEEIIFASPPGPDGKLTPEVVYVAHKVGAKKIVLAGGAQAIAAMAYGTESVPKVDKIMGPGNQFVTAAKMYVSNDTTALCGIDMPAGPSEVLVVADAFADPDFVASDLLSQAEHGVDSQVILVAVGMTSEQIDKIDEAVHRQALELPRVDIVRKCIAHSYTIVVDTYADALAMSNRYAPEHLILQIEDAESYVDSVTNAGSVFVGAYSPESCGDYSSGTNHTLPTYGYARMYSGVNTSTFQKFITSQVVTPKGLQSIGKAVMDLAAVEGLDAHRNAVKIRMEKLGYL